MIILDYSDKRPLYEQVASRLETLIINGALEPESKLPSVRNMAIDLSINPNTIQRAYAELERSGFIYSVKGKGNFVSPDKALIVSKKEKTMEELATILTTCKEQDITKEDVLSLVRSVYGEESK